MRANHAISERIAKVVAARATPWVEHLHLQFLQRVGPQGQVVHCAPARRLHHRLGCRVGAAGPQERDRLYRLRDVKGPVKLQEGRLDVTEKRILVGRPLVTWLSAKFSWSFFSFQIYFFPFDFSLSYKTSFFVCICMKFECFYIYLYICIFIDISIVIENLLLKQFLHKS